MAPELQEAYKRERIEKPYTKKDGTVASKPRVWYRCYKCLQEFKMIDTQLDHVIPVGPTPGSRNAPPELDWNTFIKRLFCASSNLKPVCKPCHKQKTQKETDARSAAYKELKDAS